MLSIIENYVIYFFIYSILGWMFDTFCHSLLEKKVTKTGFLSGPYCPIYGVSALLFVIIFRDISDPLVIFLGAVTLASVVEYMTSLILEKLFNMRWWDYSWCKFHINGRVALHSSLAFGLLALLLVMFVQPFVLEPLIMQIPTLAKNIITATLLIIFVIDLVITVAGFYKFNDKLHEISIELKDKQRENDQKADEIVKNLLKQLSFQERRILKAFPHLKHLKYNDALASIRSALHKKSTRTKK